MNAQPFYLHLIKRSATLLFWFVALLSGVILFFVVKTTSLEQFPSFTTSLSHVKLKMPPVKVAEESYRQVAINANSPVSVSFYYSNPAQLRKDFGVYASQILFPVFLLISLLLIGCWQAKRIFDTLGTPNVFSRANVKRIQVIASLFIVYKLLDVIVWLIVQKDVLAMLDTYGIKYDIIHSLSFSETFVFAILLFGLAEVFRSGLQLKQEQDLTI
ncbi:MAG: DUF2975 domain-containing protein [Cytophagales bacterium]|nr:MAG: DUF2975 domain-containing protein [Cytophagales bacterium]